MCPIRIFFWFIWFFWLDYVRYVWVCGKNILVFEYEFFHEQNFFSFWESLTRDFKIGFRFLDFHSLYTMPSLAHWENKIKERQKQVSFRDFVKHIASWNPVMFYKNGGVPSRFPMSPRSKTPISVQDFEQERENQELESWIRWEKIDFFVEYAQNFKNKAFANFFHYAKNENIDFADSVQNSKNVYLSQIAMMDCENILYSFSTKDGSRNVFGSFMSWDHSENVYMSTAVIQSFGIFYSRYVKNSNNVWFSTNLSGCTECFGCSYLENASYYINNKNFSKEDYFRFKSELLQQKDHFTKWYDTTLQIPGANIASENVSWQAIVESENVENGYFVYNIKNGRNIILWWTKNGNKYVQYIYRRESIWR